MRSLTEGVELDKMKVDARVAELADAQDLGSCVL